MKVEKYVCDICGEDVCEIKDWNDKKCNQLCFTRIGKSVRTFDFEIDICDYCSRRIEDALEEIGVKFPSKEKD